MKIDGRCYCGEITFTAEVDPAGIRICHCTDCQQLSGSAFRAVIAAPAESFRLVTGSPRSYIKIAESGNRRRHAFCGNCGSPMFACAEADPVSYTLRVGTIVQRDALSPYVQIWRRSALKWIDTIAAIPFVEKQ
jgi:hypothetical protein